MTTESVLRGKRRGRPCGGTCRTCCLRYDNIRSLVTPTPRIWPFVFAVSERRDDLIRVILDWKLDDLMRFVNACKELD